MTNTLIAADVAQAGLSNRRDWQYHAERINKAWGKQVESILETGRYLVEAHDEMERRSFEAMVQQKLAFGPSTARKLIVIARHPILSNCSHANKLPPSWDTLYTLTTLDKKLGEGTLREKLADGSINPKLERKDVAEWRKGKQNEQGEVTVDGKTIEPKPSLKAKLDAANAKVASLEARLKSTGSLFDLKNDKVANIAVAIAANISEDKAAALAKAIPEAIKDRKRKQQKPAG